MSYFTVFKALSKIAYICVLTAFAATTLNIPPVQAGEVVVPVMPLPGTRIDLSPAFTPAQLKGIVIHPENALQFDFLIEKGQGNLTDAQKQGEYAKLVKYFLASLTVPDQDQWVNLSPYEKDRIIKENFGRTEMGRDLLAQDYLLKQMTSSLMYPESHLGKSFWDKVYTRSQKEYGTTNFAVSTFNKVWIIPDKAVIQEHGNTAYVVQSHLKVMLEQDYLAAAKNQPQPKAPQGNPLTQNVIRQIILPALEKEVNEGKNFALLRQVYSGMLLAAWYKRALKESLLGKAYADKSKVQGVNQDPGNNEAIYQQYLSAFKKGVYNYIKEEEDVSTRMPIQRKYFAGGMRQIDFDRAAVVQKVGDSAMRQNITPATDAAMVNLKDANGTSDLAMSSPLRIMLWAAASISAAVVAGVTAVVWQGGGDSSQKKSSELRKKRLPELSPEQKEELQPGIDAMRHYLKSPATAPDDRIALEKFLIAMATGLIEQPQQYLPTLTEYIGRISPEGGQQAGASVQDHILDEMFSHTKSYEPRYSSPLKYALTDLGPVAELAVLLHKQGHYRNLPGVYASAYKRRTFSWEFTMPDWMADEPLDILARGAWPLQEKNPRKVAGLFAGFVRAIDRADPDGVLYKARFGEINVPADVSPAKWNKFIEAWDKYVAEWLVGSQNVDPDVANSMAPAIRDKLDLRHNPRTGRYAAEVHEIRTDRAMTVARFVSLAVLMGSLSLAFNSDVNEGLGSELWGNVQKMNSYLANPSQAKYDGPVLEQVLGAIASGRVPVTPQYAKDLAIYITNFSPKGHYVGELLAITLYGTPTKNQAAMATIVAEVYWTDPEGKFSFLRDYLKSQLPLSKPAKEVIEAALARPHVAPKTADNAQLAPSDVGGIDLNAQNLDLQIKRDGKGVPLPLAQQDMAQVSQIAGFIPVILEIKPASRLPGLGKLK